MNRLHTIIIAIVLGLVNHPAGAGTPGVDPLLPGRAIVRLAPGVTIHTFLTTLNGDFPTIAASVSDRLTSRHLFLLQHTPLPHPDIDVLENALNVTYVNQGLLVYGELLYEGKAPEGSSGSIWVSSLATFSAFNSQYFRDKVQLPAALGRTTGASTVIAVLDTGVDGTHPVLAGRLAGRGTTSSPTPPTPPTSATGRTMMPTARSTNWLVTARLWPAWLRRAPPSAHILPVIVLNSDGKGDNWRLTKGLFYAIDRGVEVINLSLTSTYDSFAVKDAIAEATTHGIVVVAAAGNWNRNSPREYPAMDDDVPVIGVAATDDNDVKGDFSNFSNRLFISAPGANVFSGNTPIPDRSVVGTLPGGAYGFSQGTSMATPLLSAAAALIRSQHPEWPADPTTVTAVRLALSSTAVDIDAANPTLAGLLGAGRVDIGAAVGLGPIAPRTGDLNGDGHVDVNDLLRVISDWGMVHSSADTNGSGTVEVSDLLAVIINWG